MESDAGDPSSSSRGGNIFQTIHKELKDIFRDVEDGSLDLSPDFQRAYVMKPQAASGLVVTVLNGMLVQPIIVVEERNTTTGELRKLVLDGKQRLGSLYTFWKGKAEGEFKDAPVKLTLDKAAQYLCEEDYPAYDGKSYEDLSLAKQCDYKSFSLTIVIIPEGTPLSVVMRNYAALNNGCEPHSKQHIRHATGYGPYLKLVVELAKSPQGELFREMHAMSDINKAKALDHELILRYFGMYRSAIDSTERFRDWKSRPAMTRWIDKEVIDKDDQGGETPRSISKDESDLMTKRFQVVTHAQAPM
eukprot:gene5129-34936_t